MHIQIYGVTVCFTRVYLHLSNYEPLSIQFVNTLPLVFVDFFIMLIRYSF